MAPFSPGFPGWGLCGWAFSILFFFLVLAETSKAAESFELEMNYQLPDAQVITIGNQRFRGSVVLFKPNLIDKESEGIHTATYNFIRKCDVDIRKDPHYLDHRSSEHHDFLDNSCAEHDHSCDRSGWHLCVRLPPFLSFFLSSRRVDAHALSLL